MYSHHSPIAESDAQDDISPRKRKRKSQDHEFTGYELSESLSNVNTGLNVVPSDNNTQMQLPTPKSSSSTMTPTKSVSKALPTIRDHTTDQLGPEGDEYIPRECDEAGEKKIAETGHLVDGRDYRCRAFSVPNRGDKLFMLATECARVLGYRDSYLLFNKNRSLYKIIASQAEKEDLIHQEILPFSYRSRQIAIVTARSMFRQFGSRIIVNGRRVRDDYWESKARKQGFTEEDLAGEKRPGASKARDAAAYETTARRTYPHPTNTAYGSALTSPSFDLLSQPPPISPSMQLLDESVYSTISAQSQSNFREYSDMAQPRQEITGPFWEDEIQARPLPFKPTPIGSWIPSFPLQPEGKPPIPSTLIPKSYLSSRQGLLRDFLLAKSIEAFKIYRTQEFSLARFHGLLLLPSLKPENLHYVLGAMKEICVTYSTGDKPTDHALRHYSYECNRVARRFIDVEEETHDEGFSDTKRPVSRMKEEVTKSGHTTTDYDQSFLIHAGSRKPINAKVHVVTNTEASDHLNYQLPTKISSSGSSLEQDSIHHTSEDETEYSTDEVSDSICSLDSTNTANIKGNLGLLKPILSASKQSLVDRVMKAFWKNFQDEIESSRLNDYHGQNTEQNTLAQNSETGGGSTTYTPSSRSDPTASSNTSGSTNRKGKQKRKNDDNDEDNGDDGDREPKRQKLLSPPILHDDKNKFACPYRKNNPRKYRSNNKQWRSCALTPLENVARVKGHLYRHHMIYPCQRCKQLFKSQEEIGLHLKEVKGCELRDIEISDGITSEIVERLKSKKKAHRDETEEDRWRKMYILIFPGSIVPPPYFEQPSDSTELEEYEEYCRRELPRVVRAAVEEIVNRETQPMEDRLISQLESIIRNSQHQVYASYRSSSTSNTSNRPVCEKTSKPAPEGSASMQLNTPVNFQNEQSVSAPSSQHSRSYPEFSRQENDISSSSEPHLLSTSGYVSNSSMLLSPPRPSIELAELQGCSNQAATFATPQSGASASATRLPHGINSGESSSSQNDLDWSIVPEPGDTSDSILDPNDPIWPALGEEKSDDFDWDNFMSESFRNFDKLP